MSRTEIPPHLIHRPEEVERDAERFDHLCGLAEEIALPIVREALGREAAATGAEILSEEATRALAALAEEAAILDDLDEERLLGELRISLRQALPPLDEEECREHARALSQVLMSAWLETLRGAEAERRIVVLTDSLLPDAPSGRPTRFLEQFGLAKPSPMQDMAHATAAFAVNEEDVAGVMTTMRHKLFPEASLVDLPFDLALVGAPGRPVLLMSRPLYERLINIRWRFDRMEIGRADAEPRAREVRLERAVPATAPFATATARRAAQVLSERLPADSYWYLEKVASPNSGADDLAAQVRRALNTQ